VYNAGSGTIRISSGEVSAANTTFRAIHNQSTGQINLLGDPNITGVIFRNNAAAVLSVNSVTGFPAFGPSTGRVYTLAYAATPAHNTVAVTGGAARIANFALVDPLRVLAVSGSNLVLVSYVGSINAQSWVVGETISLSAPAVDNPPGETTTAQGWQISDNGSSDWTDFTLPSTVQDKSLNGKYLRYYATFSNGQTHYSNTVTLQVLTQTEREVTILMRDSYGDGWDGNGALRINVNGTDVATNVRVSGSTNTYTFFVDSGDEVILYWVAGSSQGENAFAVYYTSDQPNPAFNPTSGTTDTGKLLVSRQYNSMGGVAGGANLGTFTVP
jgi:hypothetical protein